MRGREDPEVPIARSPCLRVTAPASSASPAICRARPSASTPLRGRAGARDRLRAATRARHPGSGLACAARSRRVPRPHPDAHPRAAPPPHPLLRRVLERRARSAGVRPGGRGRRILAGGPGGPRAPDGPDLRALRRRWAELIRRIYEVDPLVCPRCGSPMRSIALITEPRVIGQILKHLAAKGVDARSPPDAAHNHRPAV